MDTKLADGDQALDGRGLLAEVEGVQELLQQAMIRLTVRRGSFALDPQLGSRLHELKRSGIPRMEQLALGYAQDALAPMGKIQAQSAVCSYSPQADRLSIQLNLQLAGQVEEMILRL